jgi:hypothetical protein
MRTLVIRVLVPLASVATLCVLQRAGQAAELPHSINTPPSGPGTEQVNAAGVRTYQQGLQASAGLGTGFSSTYGLGVEGDLGYTFQQGIYAGANLQYFQGHSINDRSAHATFVGGEVGYKWFPTDRVEVRPFVFVGPAFVTTVAAASNPSLPPNVVSNTTVAVQPGVIAQYHFGNAFVGGDAHYMLAPTPNTLALMAMAGLAF